MITLIVPHIPDTVDPCPPLTIPARSSLANRSWFLADRVGSFAYFAATFACAYALIGAMR